MGEEGKRQHVLGNKKNLLKSVLICDYLFYSLATRDNLQFYFKHKRMKIQFRHRHLLFLLLLVPEFLSSQADY
jgi:hypothetical protein